MAIILNIPVAISKGRTRFLVVFSPFSSLDEGQLFFVFLQKTPVMAIGDVNPRVEKQGVEKQSRFDSKAYNPPTNHPWHNEPPDKSSKAFNNWMPHKNLETAVINRHSGIKKVSRETLVKHTHDSIPAADMTKGTRKVYRTCLRRYKYQWTFITKMF